MSSEPIPYRSEAPQSLQSAPQSAPLRQTLALILDAYRELNARKMFWVVLILSALAIAAFAIVGVRQRSLWIAGFELDVHPLEPRALYKAIFTSLMIGFWLTWAVAILAIISVAGIFPDFISGGSIDLYLAKPISRLRLFFTKYAVGMLFVILQVTIFSILAFFLLRIRGGFWAPGVFLAIPIVVCFFSYLYAICVLIGLVTRSTLAALLLTILIWALIFGMHMTEQWLLSYKLAKGYEVENQARRLADVEKRLAAAEAAPTTAPARIRSIENDRATRAQLQSELTASENDHRKARRFYSLAHGLMLILPKTTETTALLDRHLLTRDEHSALLERSNEDHGGAWGMSREARRAAKEVEEINRSRTLGWVLGTSLTFEAVVVLLAAWVFCRRDF